MTKRKSHVKLPPREIVHGKQYPRVHSKLVDWVDHEFEEVDLSDWKTDNFRQLRIFAQSEGDRE